METPQRLVVLFGVWILTGCVTSGQKLEPSVFYKRDMSIQVNGYQGVGAIVVPKAAAYQMEIAAETQMDLFTLQSCHREFTQSVAAPGWFAKRKALKYEYRPVSELETSGSCALQLGGYDKATGRHSWGFIDFESDAETLPALIRCNGSEYNSRGVSACQSRKGLWQSITFAVEVVTSPDRSCDVMMAPDGKAFVYEMPKDVCVFAFMEKAKPNRIHRLTTLGYEDLVIRGE